MHNISLGSFYGMDSFFDLLIGIVALFIAHQSHKIYRLIKERNYKFFSLAFLTIGIAFMLKIVSNITIIHRVIIQRSNFIITLTSELEQMQIVNFVSFILFKILLLVGFLILFLITTKTKDKEKIFLFFYLAFLSILFSIYFNFIFHLTITILLIFLCIYFHKNYEKKKTRSRHHTLIAFYFILAGHIIDIFYSIISSLYILGETLLLIGFIILLFNHIQVKNEPKKNKARGDSGPLRNTKKK